MLAERCSSFHFYYYYYSYFRYWSCFAWHTLDDWFRSWNLLENLLEIHKSTVSYCEYISFWLFYEAPFLVIGSILRTYSVIKWLNNVSTKRFWMFLLVHDHHEYDSEQQSSVWNLRLSWLVKYCGMAHHNVVCFHGTHLRHLPNDERLFEWTVKNWLVYFKIPLIHEKFLPNRKNEGSEKCEDKSSRTSDYMWRNILYSVG